MGEVVGSGYGEGFILQCLLHHGGSVSSVVGGILDNTLPPQLQALPIGLKLHEDPHAALAPKPLERTLSSEDKRLVLQQTERQKQVLEHDEYDDDGDDGEASPILRVGAAGSESEGSDEEHNSSEEDSRWGNDKGGKGKGKGKGKYRGPVQGQTYQAARKEANKARIGNHNRRANADAKMRRGMMG